MRPRHRPRHAPAALLALVLAAPLVAVGCRKHERVVAAGTGTTPANLPPNGTPTTAPAAAARDTSLRQFLPDPAKTPGDTLAVTSTDVCTPGYSKKVRNVPSSVKRQVYASYGIATHEPGEYEVDHLISLELGGSNSVRNLWPESFRTQPWNAHVKDALENELHARVCAGKMPLHDAQQAIARNWIAAYKIYVSPTPSAAPPGSARHRRRG